MQQYTIKINPFYTRLYERAELIFASSSLCCHLDSSCCLFLFFLFAVSPFFFLKQQKCLHSFASEFHFPSVKDNRTSKPQYIH